LYRTLRGQFPESNQALLSALSEGDLLLSLADHAGALAAYDAYLARRPPGSLTEEALFGRARALGKLGQSAEERQTWEELARRFPRSAYAPAAKRRLEDLGR
jgi:TolA-binding protein